MLEAQDIDPLTIDYLHSGLPVGNYETALETALDLFNSLDSPATITAGSPWMDETAPTEVSARTMVATSLANPDYRKNFLVGYWVGNAVGRVYDAEASVWIKSATDLDVEARLFGDGGVGIGAPFAAASQHVIGGPDARLVTFDFGAAAGNVEKEIVLSIGASVDAQPFAITIEYDSLDRASSLSFRLTDPVSPPPTVWTSAPGWSNVTLVNATHAHRETSLAISPQDDDLLFVCSPSGVPSTTYGHSFFHLSRDGGATWEYLEVETGASDPRKFTFEGGDCDVAFDAAGTMYAADTWLGSLSVGSSSDGGLTWMGTALASSAPVVDRPWLVGGPAGTVHVAWQDVQALMPSAIWYARSTDFGLTFTPAVPVATASPDGAFTWEGNLVVSPDQHDLYLVYTRRGGAATGGLDQSGPESVWVAASHDGGATWGQHLVANMPNPASYLYPSIGMDAGGKLHVVFSSKTASDRPIWYTVSEDFANSWSAPIKVMAGVAGYSPWVVGGELGEAAIQWYGTLDPLSNGTSTFDWYFFAARIQDGVVTSAGVTTETPIFHGVSATPEFNQVRLDSQGRMHLGASAYYEDPDGGTGWAIFHQRSA